MKAQKPVDPSLQLYRFHMLLAVLACLQILAGVFLVISGAVMDSLNEAVTKSTLSIQLNGTGMTVDLSGDLSPRMSLLIGYGDKVPAIAGLCMVLIGIAGIVAVRNPHRNFFLKLYLLLDIILITALICVICFAAMNVSEMNEYLAGEARPKMRKKLENNIGASTAVVLIAVFAVPITLMATAFTAQNFTKISPPPMFSLGEDRYSSQTKEGESIEVMEPFPVAV